MAFLTHLLLKVPGRISLGFVGTLLAISLAGCAGGGAADRSATRALPELGTNPTAPQAMAWLQQALSGLDVRYSQLTDAGDRSRRFQIRRLYVSVATDPWYPDDPFCQFVFDISEDGGRSLRHTVELGGINRVDVDPVVNTRPSVVAVHVYGGHGDPMVVWTARGDTLRSGNELTLIVGQDAAFAEGVADAIDAVSREKSSLRVDGHNC
jgi:hypothetical protein